MVRQNLGIPVEHAYPGSAVFAPNSIVPFKLDTNAIIEEIDVQFVGTLTLAGWTTAPTARVEAIENLISQLSFNGNAKQNGAQAVNFSAVDAAFLYYKTKLMSGTSPTRVGINTANGVYNFQTNFVKYFGAKRIKGAYNATFLDSRLLQSLVLNLQTRDVGAMIIPGSGVGGTAVLSNAQAFIHSREWQGAQNTTSAPYCKETQRSFDLTNYAGLDKKFPDIPIGGILTRQTYKACVSADVNYADPSNAVVFTTQRVEGAHVKTEVTGAGGTLTPNNNLFAMLQAQNKLTYKQENFPAGYATVEYSRTGNLGDCLNLTGSSILSAANYADITFTAGDINTLWITDEQIISN